MTELTYDEIRNRGQEVIDGALPLRDEADQLEAQVDTGHPASPLTRDAHRFAHWAFRDAQDAMDMVSTALLLKAECRLGTATLIIDKAKAAIGAGDGAVEISESAPDIPEQYIAAFISERSILFDEADALMTAFLTRVEKPFLYDAWTKHIYEHWTSVNPRFSRRTAARQPE